MTARVPADELVLALGRALHASGASAPRLEFALSQIARRLGLVAQFFSTPTSVFASFGEGSAERTRLIRVEPSQVNLEKMAGVDAVIEGMLRGAVPPEEAASRVDAILSLPSRYGPALQTAAGGAASAGTACFFGGGPREVAVAGGLGLLVSGLGQLTLRVPSLGGVLVFVAAVLVSFLSGLASWALGPISIHSVALSGLVGLMPGLTLVTAMTEIATQHLVAGTARLTGAIVVFLSMGFGIAVGERLAGLLPDTLRSAAPEGLPAWATVIALVVSSAAFTVLFRAHPRAFAWILPCGVVAFLGARVGSLLLSPELGAFAGAILAGMASNTYARVLHRPAAVPLVPAIMFLVPGSMGFQSLTALLEHDVVAGIETAFLMILVAVALVTGLFFANALVPPRRAL